MQFGLIIVLIGLFIAILTLHGVENYSMNKHNSGFADITGAVVAEAVVGGPYLQVKLYSCNETSDLTDNACDGSAGEIGDIPCTSEDDTYRGEDQEPYLKGTVTAITTLTDYCGSDNRTLVEYSCNDDNYLEVELYHCACSDGYCDGRIGGIDGDARLIGCDTDTDYDDPYTYGYAGNSTNGLVNDTQSATKTIGTTLFSYITEVYCDEFTIDEDRVIYRTEYGDVAAGYVANWNMNQYADAEMYEGNSTFTNPHDCQYNDSGDVTNKLFYVDNGAKSDTGSFIYYTQDDPSYSPVCYGNFVCDFYETDNCTLDVGEDYECYGAASDLSGSRYSTCDTTNEDYMYRICCNVSCNSAQMQCAGYLDNDPYEDINFTQCTDVLDETSTCCDEEDMCVFDGMCYADGDVATDINGMDMVCSYEHWCPYSEGDYLYYDTYDTCIPTQAACYDESDTEYCEFVYPETSWWTDLDGSTPCIDVNQMYSMFGITTNYNDSCCEYEVYSYDGSYLSIFFYQGIDYELNSTGDGVVNVTVCGDTYTSGSSDGVCPSDYANGISPTEDDTDCCGKYGIVCDNYYEIGIVEEALIGETECQASYNSTIYIKDKDDPTIIYETLTITENTSWPTIIECLDDYWNDVGYTNATLSEGEYYVVVEKEGYNTRTENITLSGTSNSTLIQLYLSSECQSDCTMNDGVCYAECNGSSGCEFYNNETLNLCDGANDGDRFEYSEDYEVECCTGTPEYFERIEYTGVTEDSEESGGSGAELCDIIVKEYYVTIRGEPSKVRLLFFEC